MKRIALTSLLCGIILFSMGACSVKVTPNTNIHNIEGNGNLIINSNLMNSLNRLGASYEFVPLEYKGGVARGIISPSKIDRYSFESGSEVGRLNPLRYIEYNVDVLDKNNILKETGNVLSLSEEMMPYTLNTENPQNIILKDNKRKVEKIYKSKLSEDFIVKESVSYSNDGIPLKNNEFYNKNGESIKVDYSIEKIVGDDSRYVYSSFSYSNQVDENGIGIDSKNVLVIYDSKTEGFYESEISEWENYELYENKIFYADGQLYYLNRNGKIDKILLDDGKIFLEDYYNLQLEENEVVVLSYAYTINNVDADNIFVKIGTKDGGGTIFSGESVLNMKEKSINELPKSEELVEIGKIFSNSDNLAIISIIENTNEGEVWIVRYENGEFVKLIQIDKYSQSGGAINARSIVDILYDNETNTFFIKRKISIDTKLSYQYEVLKL